MSAENAVMFTFVISISIGVAMALMLSWHGYLVLTNQVSERTIDQSISLYPFLSRSRTGLSLSCVLP